MLLERTVRKKGLSISGERQDFKFDQGFPSRVGTGELSRRGYFEGFKIRVNRLSEQVFFKGSN